MLLHIWLQYSVKINILYVLRNQKNSRDWLYRETCFIAVVWNRTHRHLQNLPILITVTNVYWGLHTLFHLMFTTVIESQCSHPSICRWGNWGLGEWVTCSCITGSWWDTGSHGNVPTEFLLERILWGALDWQLLSLWLHHGVHEGPQPMTNVVELWVPAYCCLVWESSTGCPWLEDSPSI